MVRPIQVRDDQRHLPVLVAERLQTSLRARRGGDAVLLTIATPQVADEVVQRARVVLDAMMTGSSAELVRGGGEPSSID